MNIPKKGLPAALSGEVISEGSALSFKGAGTDSRKAIEGRLFFALKGPVFDGHDFLKEARKSGARGFIISDRGKAQALLKGLSRPPFILHVEDTLKALQALAMFWRRRLQLQIIAVTGSAGKTTVKNFMKALLKGRQAYFSPKSWNNHWGVPLSILAASRRRSILVQEIGASQKGEIASLTALCSPQAAAAVNVGAAHLEGFGSVLNTAREKREIYLKSPKALWVFNRDNSWTEAMFQKIGKKRLAERRKAQAAAPQARRLPKSPMKGKIITFSRKGLKGAQVCLKGKGFSHQIEGVIDGEAGKARLGFRAAEEDRSSLMCAIALSLAAGEEAKALWQRLPECRLPKGRRQWIEVERPQRLSLLFDAYNANPASMRLFFKSFAGFGGRRTGFVLGDMKELGAQAKFRHKQLASNRALQKARFLLYIGDYGGLIGEALRRQGFQGKLFWQKERQDDHLPALKFLKEEAKEGFIVGFKASRAFHLERLLFQFSGVKISF